MGVLYRIAESCRGRIPVSLKNRWAAAPPGVAIFMPSIPGRHFLRNLVERRSLIYQLVRRDFQQRFVGSAGGWIWSVVHPLVLLISWSFVFQICMRYRLSPDQLTQNYSLFLFAGMLPWLLFSETVQRASVSLIEQSNLITKTVFPAEVIPVSVFLSSLISHALAVLLAVGVIAFWEGHFSVMLLLVPVYAFLTGMMAVGLGWITSSLQVYLRDTSQMLSVILTFWFWMTPIFIEEDQFPEQFRFILKVNPLAFVVRAYRVALLSSDFPPMSDLAAAALYATGLFLVGGLVFRHMKKGFADVL